jgi:hypothetical protein
MRAGLPSVNFQGLIIFVFQVVSSVGFCQSDLPFEKKNTYADLAVSASQKASSIALSWYKSFTPLSKLPRLHMGLGLRVTGFLAANRFYTTAPAKYTSPIQNPFTILSRNIIENIDTITTATTITYFLNLAASFEYSLTTRLSTGCNIDLAGMSFGPSERFDIISSVYDPGQSPVAIARPTKYNLLLTSDNDYGSLNSEFYLRYQQTARIGLKVGLTFLFNEFKTSEKFSFDNGRIVNDRYRFKSTMVLFGASYKLSNSRK